MITEEEECKYIYLFVRHRVITVVFFFCIEVICELCLSVFFHLLS
jgi:hypothetical protein